MCWWWGQTVWSSQRRGGQKQDHPISWIFTTQTPSLHNPTKRLCKYPTKNRFNLNELFNGEDTIFWTLFCRLMYNVQPFSIPWCCSHVTLILTLLSLQPFVLPFNLLLLISCHLFTLGSTYSQASPPDTERQKSGLCKVCLFGHEG